MSAAEMDGLTLGALGDAARWVAWQTEAALKANGTAPGKPTKVPYDPATGRKAKANNPATWSTRAAAEARAPQLPRPFGSGGIGFELGDHAGSPRRR